MAVEYTTAGGVRKTFGPQADPVTRPEPCGAKESTRGNRTELEYRFTYDNLPAWSAGKALDACYPVIPAYAVIESAVLLVEVPFAGGTDLEVGTFLASTGVAVAADGIIPKAVGVVANLDAAGEGVYGTGIQCLASLYNTGAVAATGIIAATNTVGADPVVVGVVTTGTFTAGRARLLVTYVRREG